MRWPLARRPASRTSRAGSEGRGAALALALLLTGCAARPVSLDGPMGPPPPIPVAPHDGEVVSTARPTFRWKLVRGEDIAELTLCRSALCKDVLEVARVAGGEWTPDHDLPSGLLYYRLRGGVGTRLGTESTLENRVAVEGKVALEGKHAALIIAWDRRPFGERLLSVAERGIDFFAEFLGVPVPDITSRIYLYRTDVAFQDVRRRFAPRMDGLHGLRGFSNVWGSHVRSLDSDVEDTITATHELVHAFQNKRVRLHGDQPMWLREGMATLLSHRLLAATQGFDAAADYLHSMMRDRLRTAARKGRILTVQQLLDADEEVREKNTEAFYAESFLLLDLLDSPAQPERQARLRAWAKEVAAMRGFLASSRINRSFREAFGPLPALDEELQRVGTRR